MQGLIVMLAEKGWSNSVYDGFGLLGIIAAFAFCSWYGKKLGLKTWQTLLLISIVLIVSFFSIHIIIIDALEFVEDHSTLPTMFITSIIRVLLLMPMVGFWMSKTMRLEWGRVCDMLVFVPLLIGSIGAQGCVFTGCCRGYPCEIGIFNTRIGEYVFPVQILNAAIMAAIAIYLYVRSMKNGFISDGFSYPIMLILFGSTRFITEFLSDNNKVLMGCSVLSIHALKDFIIGIAVILVMKKKIRRQKRQYLE